MPKSHLPLPVLHLDADLSYLRPTELPEVVHWDDPAIQALIDFKYLKAEVIGPDEPIDVALLAVKKCSYHALLVVNQDHQVSGLVTAEDLLGEKPLKVIQERRLPRADIFVGLVMIPQRSLLAIDIESLRHAKVGHVVETLRVHKQHFMLVVKQDEETQAPTIRGLFSIGHLSKQMGRDLTGDLSEAQSIAELQHDLHLHD